MNRDLKTECFHCINKINGSDINLVACINPDPNMTGDQTGMDNGQFFYPLNFNPSWKTKLCSNFKVSDESI